MRKMVSRALANVAALIPKIYGEEEIPTGALRLELNR